MDRHEFSLPMVAALMAAFLLNGCGLFGGGVIDRGLAGRYETRRLLDATERAAAVAALFPPVVKLNWAGRIEIEEGPEMVGHDTLGISWFSQDPEHLRVRGFVDPESSLFDLIVIERVVTVMDHRIGVLYQGTAEAGAGPLGIRYGFEPGDLALILEPGRWLSTAKLETAASDDEDEIALTAAPADADGLALRRVWLEARTGMLRRAEWRRGGQTWTVDYCRWLEWEGDIGKRLLPAELTIRGDAPELAAELTIERYFLDEMIPASIFAPTVPYRMTGKPLSDFARRLPQP